MARNEKVWAIVQLTAGMTLAGSSVVVGRSLARELPVFLTTCASLLVAWLVMLPLVWRRRAEILLLRRREWGYLFLQGVCGIVLFRLFMLHGLRRIGAAQAGIITGTTPAVLTLLAWAMLGERPRPGALAGVACAVAGGICLATPAGAEATGGKAMGSLLVFCAVICEALFSIFRKRVAATVSPDVNTAVLVSCALLAALPLAILDVAQFSGHVTPALLAAIIYYGAVATVLAYLFWTNGVGKVSAATAGITCAAMPVSTLILSALILGESLAAPHLWGCGAVALGIIVAALPPLDSRYHCRPVLSGYNKKTTTRKDMRQSW